MAQSQDPFGARATLTTSSGSHEYFSLEKLESRGRVSLARMPFSMKILLESVLRQVNGFDVREEDVTALCAWSAAESRSREFPFKPARVIMQDFTGVPAIVDLAAMRDAMATLGGDPQRINPVIPVDLVIDHSVQVDLYASSRALSGNASREFQRNRERYEFLRWGAGAFSDFRVVPPATGIVHQVNLEYLASVVQVRAAPGQKGGVAFPDTLVGTDSHTPMINGIGVLGWGVGGIEAEAALLGQPLYMLIPEVVGMRLSGALREGVTATDLVLTVTQALRTFGVVDKIVEFFGPGLSALSVADRATISNMSPEYGATAGFFPVDEKTLDYLRFTGRSAELLDLVERYCRAQGLFRSADTPDPQYSAVLDLDLGTVETSLAGPKRPQDRLPLSRARGSWRQAAPAPAAGSGNGALKSTEVTVSGLRETMRDGAVVIAAITSCTNTSNPAVMLAAGLLARNAVKLGLRVPAYVKTSFAPGSKVVTQYLDRAGLSPYLEALGFHLVGYGCTTCIGNSGPLLPAISTAIKDADLTVASVLSGNRNFEGRIHPEVKANYLASPPLVVAYALAGSLEVDLATEPLGYDKAENAVYLRDIWPTLAEIDEAIQKNLTPEMFRTVYASVFTGDEAWQNVRAPQNRRYAWDGESTYIRQPTFFQGISSTPPEIPRITGARVLAVLGDSVTTDHISPAGSIPEKSPAGRWLIAHGVKKEEFNTYGSRRGNHEVMIRGTFANIRIRNRLVPGVEGGVTRHLPSGEQMSIFDASERYVAEKVPLLVIAGKEYGSGSSRDWAAKGTLLLGVRAVIAESYERIHRSNLVGMGLLPLQFRKGENAESLGLTGEEVYEIGRVEKPGQSMEVSARDPSGTVKKFTVIARIDTAVELEYYRNGGILPTVLRGFAKSGAR
ncbi:MAG TPA: aconitate hydratase AcnA [Spirochaetia bacterium]|nr:aconitate hydratase AcnA [Spirochaetia bacterium]